jgi:hypothetical protein
MNQKRSPRIPFMINKRIYLKCGVRDHFFFKKIYEPTRRTKMDLRLNGLREFCIIINDITAAKTRLRCILILTPGFCFSVFLYMSH